MKFTPVMVNSLLSCCLHDELQLIDRRKVLAAEPIDFAQALHPARRSSIGVVVDSS